MFNLKCKVENVPDLPILCIKYLAKNVQLVKDYCNQIIDKRPYNSCKHENELESMGK